MLNMKKGLAIVLAAATALSFAPVSTLGLTGVVEAQAANTTTTKDVASGDQTATINLTKGTAYTDGTNAFEYTITTAGNLTADGSNPTVTGLTVALTGSGTSYTVKVTGTPTAAATAQSFVFNDAGTGTHKFTLTVNVNNPATEPTGSISKVNAITAATDTYDVYVKAGSTYDIVTGDTKVGDYKTSDENYLWKAYTTSAVNTEFTGATSLSDGISDVSYKAGKGLTITAAGQEDSTTAGTPIYLKPFSSDGTASSASPITVNVHVYKNTGSLTLGNGQTSVKKDVASNIASEIGLAESGSTYVLNKGEIVDGQATNFTFGQAYITGEKSISLTQPSDTAIKAKNAEWNVTGGNIGSFNVKFQIGYVYKGSFEYASLDTVVNVKDASDAVKVIDANGNQISYTGSVPTGTTAADEVIKAGITLTKGQTFDLGALTGVYNGTVKVNDATFSYESSSAAVTVSDKGVLTAVSKVSGAVITVTAKEGSIELTKAHVLVNVNNLVSDELTIKDESGKAYTNVPQYATYSNNGTPVTVSLTDTTAGDSALYYYFNNIVKAKDSKIAYATIDLVDNKSVTLTATSANGNSMPSPVIANTQVTTVNAAGVPTTTNSDTVVTSGLAGGKITVTAKAAGYAIIKFTSQDSAKATGATAYVFVRVLSTPEATIYGIEDTYSVAAGKYVSYTSGTRRETQYSLDLSDKFTTNGGSVTYTVMSKSDYPNDDPTAVKVSDGVVTAYKAGATAHVKIKVTSTDNTSETSKIVEIKTVEPKQNTLTVSAVSGSAIDTTLTIDKVTNLTVSADYQEKGISVVYDAASVLDKAVLFTTDYNKNVTLYPNKDGFSVITISAAGDGETIAPAEKQIVVTYKAQVVPAKVTGLKVSNKKGAKVTVKFNKVTTAPTMKYYVQKKIGKKTSGKSVGSTKATLSVKKGATVKVRVKAYYYDANGQKHVGAWSSWKTLKTDKK